VLAISIADIFVATNFLQMPQQKSFLGHSTNVYKMILFIYGGFLQF